MTTGYRKKTPEVLAWNAIRRVAMAKATVIAATYREKILNDMLSELSDHFQVSLASGELPELEAEYESWVEDAMKAAGS